MLFVLKGGWGGVKSPILNNFYDVSPEYPFVRHGRFFSLFVIDFPLRSFLYQGTSGAADVIAFGLDAANKMATEEVVDDKEPVPLENRWALE